MAQQITSSCPTCTYNNPQGTHWPQLIQPIERHGSHPREAWQMEFTQMPPCRRNKHLLRLVDTSMGLIEALPTWTERAIEVVNKLLHESIPRFDLPKSLQSDSGPSFVAVMVQSVSKALSFKCHLHCAWRPQSSGK